MKQYPTLYKRAKTGKVQAWMLSSHINALVSSWGEFGGLFQTHMDSVFPKASRTLDEQLELEAQSKLKRKRDEGYKSCKDLGIERDIALLGGDQLNNALESVLPKFNTDASGDPKPMLAKAFSGMKKQDVVIVQPKLNGVRCMAMLKDGNVVFKSRKGQEYKTLAHLEDGVKKVIEALSYNTPVILDGEIYIHGMKFQDILHLVKRDQVLLESATLEYHVYDVASDEVQADRITKVSSIRDILGHHGDSSIIPVKASFCTTEQQIIELHNNYVADGYEGAIVRDMKASYAFGQRTAKLGKVKSFYDDEFPIVGVEFGDRGARDIVWVCSTSTGGRFKVTPKGTHQMKEVWANNVNSIIDKKLLTVRYLELTKDGIPSQATGIDFRDYE